MSPTMKQTRRMPPPPPNLVQRRRSRQAGEGARPGWSYELAHLRVQLLVAMAAADGHIDAEERRLVEQVVDRVSLPREEHARLVEAAHAALAAPPDVAGLLGPISELATQPALARLLVTELTRVAAADQGAHPREAQVLARVCDAVGLLPARIPAPSLGDVIEDDDEYDTARTPSPEEAEAARERLLDTVRRSLERAYASRADDAVAGTA